MNTMLATARLILLPFALATLAPLGAVVAVPGAPLQDKVLDQAPDKTSAQRRVVAGSNRLGFELLAQLLEGDAGKNVFVSPASIATALTMIWSGAGGETATAMGRTLGLEGAAREDVIAAARSLLDGLAGRKGIELRAAQAIWCRGGVVIRDDFVEQARRSFGAEVKSADFADAKTLGAINDWISKQTGGRIQGALDQIAQDEVMYLLSTIWFKARWLDRFDAGATEPAAVFHLWDGKERRVPMMHGNAGLAAYEDETLKAVQLRYGDKKTSLVVLLPADGTAAALAALVKKAAALDFPAWLEKFESADARVALPRFQIKYSAELKPALSALGMGVAFDPKADFTRMREQRDLFVSRVLHKSFIEVNEEGTEAAAVTIGGISVTSAPGKRRAFELVADRPFLFAVCDDERGTVLFAGVVLDPGA